MIKINLLPKTINQKKAVRNTAVLFGVLLVAVIAGGVTYSFNLKGQVDQKTVELGQVQQLEQQVIALEKERDDYKGKTTPIKQKVDFIKGVLTYNTKFVDLYSEVAKWTYEKVMYTSLTCDDGATLVMTAQCRSLKDLLRYWINMRLSDMFTEVVVSDISGYAGSNNQNNSGPDFSGGEIGGSQANLAGIGAINSGVDRKPVAVGTGWITFKVTCKLDAKKTIAAPAFAGTGASQPGAQGAPGADPNAAPGGMPAGGGGMPMPPGANGMPMPPTSGAPPGTGLQP